MNIRNQAKLEAKMLPTTADDEVCEVHHTTAEVMH